MTELWQSFHSRIGKLMEVRASIHHHMLGTMPDGVFGRSFAINFLKVLHPPGSPVTAQIERVHGLGIQGETGWSGSIFRL